MKYARIFTLSSALIVAASVFGVSAEARKSDLDLCTTSHLSKAECACEMALEKGSQKALRNFLKLYRGADTACNTQASTATTENSEGETENSSSSSSSSSSTTTGKSKNNNGHGNGNEGECHGGGCSDSDNPGKSGGSGGNSKGNKH